MKISIRPATLNDLEQIFQLYQVVAATEGGLARVKSEITKPYIRHNLTNALKNGICLVADNDVGNIVGEIHSYQLTPSVFKHILSELTIAVHLKYQGQGIGKLLFESLLQMVENNRQDILRVELIARESNIKAIKFYENLGFKQEGRFENRINNRNGSFEADIPMAWFNKNFSKTVFYRKIN